MNVSTAIADKTAASAATAATADDLSQKIDAVRANLTTLTAKVSDDVADRVGKAGRQITRSGRNFRATATNTVLAHPLSAVGIAMGVGLVMGLIARRG